MKKPKVIELKRPPVPDEFCPECMSLKRKPNKECKNHESYWIKKPKSTHIQSKPTYGAQHQIIIEKYQGRYDVLCVGDYSDLVVGRNTTYEFLDTFKTLREARGYAKENVNDIIKTYKKVGKKAFICLVEK